MRAVWKLLIVPSRALQNFLLACAMNHILKINWNSTFSTAGNSTKLIVASCDIVFVNGSHNDEPLTGNIKLRRMPSKFCSLEVIFSFASLVKIAYGA